MTRPFIPDRCRRAALDHVIRRAHLAASVSASRRACGRMGPYSLSYGRDLDAEMWLWPQPSWSRWSPSALEESVEPRTGFANAIGSAGSCQDSSPGGWDSRNRGPALNVVSWWQYEASGDADDHPRGPARPKPTGHARPRMSGVPPTPEASPIDSSAPSTRAADLWEKPDPELGGWLRKTAPSATRARWSRPRGRDRGDGVNRQMGMKARGASPKVRRSRPRVPSCGSGRSVSRRPELRGYFPKSLPADMTRTAIRRGRADTCRNAAR